MRYEESRYPQDWFRIGGKELKRSQNLLSSGDVEGAAFNIQQAIEKYLKGYLLSQGWDPRRIHDLDILLSEATVHDPSFADFRASCQTITHYYLIERYPLAVSWELTTEEIGESLAIAEKIIRKIKELVEG